VRQLRERLRRVSQCSCTRASGTSASLFPGIQFPHSPEQRQGLQDPAARVQVCPTKMHLGVSKNQQQQKRVAAMPGAQDTGLSASPSSGAARAGMPVVNEPSPRLLLRPAATAPLAPDAAPWAPLSCSRG